MGKLQEGHMRTTQSKAVMVIFFWGGGYLAPLVTACIPKSDCIYQHTRKGS